MQYILNETEMQEFRTLKEENSKLSHKLEVASKTREMDRQQIANLDGLVAQAKQSIKERDERIEAFKFAITVDNKKLAEQAHELLVKDAELADLSSKLREAKRDCEGTSKALTETQKISAARLSAMNFLQSEVRRLKAENVCIVTNPRNGHVRVVSVAKTDAFRQHGWTVSEEYHVDRPA